MATAWLPYNGQPDFGLDNAAFLAKAGQMTAPSTTQIEEPSDRSGRKEPDGKALSEQSETSGYGKTINGAQRDSSATNSGHGLVWQMFAGAEATLLSSASAPTESATFSDIYRAPEQKLGANRALQKSLNPSAPPAARQPSGVQTQDAKALAPDSAAPPATDAGTGANSNVGAQHTGAQDTGLILEEPDTAGKDAPHRSGMVGPGSRSQDSSSDKPGGVATSSSSEKSSAKNRSAFDGVESPTIRPQLSKSSSDADQPSDDAEEEVLPDTLNSETATELDARLFPSIETVVYSGTADATLTGNAADNTIAGNTGNDTINGGAGDDLLVGGAGNDVFVFGEQDGIDQIFDFASGDKLQFEGLENLNQLRLIEDETGMRVYFAETEVELVGTFGLQLSADWITSSR